MPESEPHAEPRTEPGSDATSPPPRHRRPGWRVLKIPAALGALYGALRLGLRFMPETAFSLYPHWVFPWLFLHDQLTLEPALVLAGSAVGLTALACLADARRWTRWAMPLVPALLFAWWMVTLNVLREVRVRADPLQGLAHWAARDMGVEVTAAITAGLAVLGGAISLRLGSLRACPECGKWWGERLSARHLGTTYSNTGGRFTAGGWAKTREVTSTGVEELRCVHCDHRYSRRYASVRREQKQQGILTSWKPR